MAEQVELMLPARLADLSHAELASLVIELVEDGRVAVALGEEVYRRLNQAGQRPAASAEWLWYSPAAVLAGASRSFPA